MVAHVAGAGVAAANASETAKVRRKIIRDCLKGAGGAKAEGWVPRSMAFPPQTCDATRTLQAAEGWNGIEHLFTGG
ncbi:hypothetical protein [Bradyrhizobium ivorense]|nr:hypothetical protein [Bradyrhizobium ivorense]